ncbi:hypothetical protein [Defluviimonas salinarum]|uniref:DUF2335 domain-containing protein n=1 Tax=Defluviimonas salinarum TaxID=2992147 RepID=A0ABT3JB50_9RHOB|nr:hypothetical protein [Defluviimonas salinarum]MCW3784659.1 hypothetical protein [Defluviimonas salinarum]
MSNSNDTKPRLGKRVATWGIRKVRHPDMIENSRKNLTMAGSAVREALRPARLDREDLLAGYNGRHADGGQARFADMVRSGDLGEADIEAIRGHHLRALFIHTAGAALNLVIGFLFMLSADGLVSLLGGVTLTIFFFAFAAVAIRHDYAAWQIAVRRFGGFREYLDHRLGSKRG